MSVPEQPWLDGYCVGKGLVRQFVAMPRPRRLLGRGTAHGSAEHGDVQLLVHPLRREAWRDCRSRQIREDIAVSIAAAPMTMADMGLAPGGRMRQEIYDDAQEFSDWDLEHRGRCFVHLTNALVWRAITGENPPTTPPTAAEYTRAGLPWFEYYGADARALSGSDRLKSVRSVTQLGQEKKDMPLPENESVDPQSVVQLRAGLGRHEVREGSF